MSLLNEDQLKAERFILNWWTSGKDFVILEGRAGTGKTFLVLDLLKKLPCCNPLVTAPTNEAVRQLEEVVGDNYPLKTTYSALGFGFDSTKEKQVLKQVRFPTELEDFNLLIVDECSFISEEVLDAIIRVKLKTIFIGHRNQLPEVVTGKVSLFNRYDSVVFKQNYPLYLLTTPVRNIGKIYDFCNNLESLIDANKRIIGTQFDLSLKEFKKYILSDEGKDKFFSEHTKVIAWTNKIVDSYNKTLRKVIYNREQLPEYLPDDKILLTSPVNFVGRLEKLTFSKILKLKNKKLLLSSNSRAKVVKIESVFVLNLSVTRLDIEIKLPSLGLLTLPIYIAEQEDLDKLYKTLLFEAYGFKTEKAKARAFENLHYIMSLFAKVKHSYAITAYRSQGMTLEGTIVDLADISKCQNVYLKHKMLYVSASRARKSLHILRK